MSNDVDTPFDYLGFDMLSWPTVDPVPQEGTLIEVDSYVFGGDNIRLEASESITLRLVETAADGFAWSDPTYSPDDDSCIILQDSNLGNFNTMYK
jgi:hypothetical protein